MIRFHKRGSFHGNFSVNTNLILANIILFFVFTILIFVNQKFLDYIALKPSNIFQGLYLWTFLTSMLMHGGFFHILANMFSLFFLGTLAERILGAKRYIYLYLISGLFAGLFFVLLSQFFTADFNTYAVGASGALFGLIGFLMIITPNLSVYVMFIPIPIKMKYAAPGILAVLWLISAAGNVPIGNTAHLGGLIAGLFYGFYLRRKFPRKTERINKYFN
ncbi:MAG: rhomboid family intramembrane serine protease [Nanoarchaeota archaeon]